MNVNDLKGEAVGLAVSGGLDSCTITRWLTDNGVKVFCLTADLGQPDEPDLEAVRQRMLASGAVEAVIVNAKPALAMAGFRVIQAQAQYEGGYWNTTGIARYVTVQALLPELQKRGINVFSHGATGRGNDQVRFQLAAQMLAPDIRVYAPWRDPIFTEKLGGRQLMIDYCAERNVPITVTKEKPYSTDANMLGLTHEAGKLESLETPADAITPGMGALPTAAPDHAEDCIIRFEKGAVVQLNGVHVTPVQAFVQANQIAGRHGVGIGIHTVENRFVGIKSRGVYESPGMELIGRAYEFLLQVALDRRGRELYQVLSAYVAKQIYQGYWFDLGTRMALSALDPLADLMTGAVTVKLYKGNIIFQKLAAAPCSIYLEEEASMDKVGTFNHADAEGFLRVLGLGAKAVNMQLCKDAK